MEVGRAFNSFLPPEETPRKKQDLDVRRGLFTATIYLVKLECLRRICVSTFTVADRLATVDVG